MRSRRGLNYSSHENLASAVQDLGESEPVLDIEPDPTMSVEPEPNATQPGPKRLFDARFINVMLLGFGFMFVFTAFQTMGNIEVS